MACKGLVFKRVDWSLEIAAKLAKAIAPEQDFIANEVIKGISQCWHIEGYGYLITRLELEPEKTLVIVAGQGRGLNDVMTFMPRIAKANGAKLIRIHSRRAGMVRMLEKLNYQTEYGLGENVFYGRI
ncbi:MAG: hypothetical protein COA83_09895 [Methylophaga sp.]|nr:MAG: hypothetical protein COA83_09895 [Methylophaga sp.]